MAKNTNSWQNKMEDFFIKMPALPKNWKEVIVKITPWIALIFGILGVISGLAGVGILSFLSPFMMMTNGLSVTSGSLLGMLLAIVASALLLAAYPGTKARKMQGWTMLFWSEGASFLSAVLSASIISGLIGAFIGFYILYQIKAYYK